MCVCLPQVFRTSALNTLAEHPHLLQLLMNHLHAPQAGSGSGGGSDEEDGDEEGEQGGDVACRVN